MDAVLADCLNVWAVRCNLTEYETSPSASNGSRFGTPSGLAGVTQAIVPAARIIRDCRCYYGTGYFGLKPADAVGILYADYCRACCYPRLPLYFLPGAIT